MKSNYFLLITVFIFLMTSCSNQEKRCSIEYPIAAKVDTVDIYFGQEVADPYRWLEDDNSEETAEWVKAQN